MRLISIHSLKMHVHHFSCTMCLTKNRTYMFSYSKLVCGIFKRFMETNFCYWIHKIFKKAKYAPRAHAQNTLSFTLLLHKCFFTSIPPIWHKFFFSSSSECPYNRVMLNTFSIIRKSVEQNVRDIHITKSAITYNY